MDFNNSIMTTESGKCGFDFHQRRPQGGQ